MSKSTGANDRQVGGNHYTTATQHWDVMSYYHVHYLCATATKYIVRARRKNGVQDYEKALHYIEKAIEWLGTPILPTSSRRLMPHDVPIMVIYDMIRDYSLTNDEGRVLFKLLSDNATAREIDDARIIVQDMIFRINHPAIEDCSLHALQPDEDDK